MSKEKKENIINAVKLFILVISMFFGLFTLLGMIWITFDLPTTWWAALLLYGLAGAAELAYIYWVAEG